MILEITESYTAFPSCINGFSTGSDDRIPEPTINKLESSTIM